MDSFGWKNFGYISFYHNNHEQKKANKQIKKEKNQKQAYTRVDLNLDDS